MKRKIFTTTFYTLLLAACFCLAFTPANSFAEQGNVISEQPASVTVNTGESTQFTCKAEGVESYQWYYIAPAAGEEEPVIHPIHDGDIGMYGAYADTLILPAASMFSALDGYVFYCELTLGDGEKIISEKATLTVKTAVTNAPEESATPESGGVGNTDTDTDNGCGSVISWGGIACVMMCALLLKKR